MAATRKARAAMPESPTGSPRPATTAQARALRRRATLTERTLWARLRDRRLNGLKFRRQAPVGPCVLDFVCVARRLVIEADGPFHDAAKDAQRDQWLAAQGFHVLRFANVDILGASPALIDTILETASLLPSREKVAAKRTDEGAISVSPSYRPTRP